MANADQALMLEILKDLQTRIGRMEHTMREITQGQVTIRQDIHGIEGHILRHDSHFIQLEERLERIERRLNLVEA